MKIILASTIIVPAYQYPTYFLVVAIALLLLVDLFERGQKAKGTKDLSVCRQKEYSLVGLNQLVNKDRQIFDSGRGLKPISKKITCAPMPDLTTWSYNDLSTQCRLLKLKVPNRKRTTLIQLLQGIKP